MADTAFFTITNMLFLLFTLSYILGALYKRRPSPIILHLLPLMFWCVVLVLSGRWFDRIRYGLWISSVLLLAALLALGAFLRMLTSLFATDVNAKKASSALPLVASSIFALVLAFADTFVSLGLRDTLAGTTTHRFSDALYFVIITFTTVGYGDVVPANHIGRLIAALFALSGYLVFAVLVAIVMPNLLSQHGRKVLKKNPTLESDLG